MAERTPTPWRVEEGTDLIWGACNPDDQSTYGMGYSIVEGKLPSWKPHKPDYEERAANAAFIVKAVNNHDALVKALKRLTNEVAGIWDAFEIGIRQEISNTNYAVVLDKLAEAERLLNHVGRGKVT